MSRTKSAKPNCSSGLVHGLSRHVDADSQAWKDGVTHVLKGVADGWLKVPIAQVFPMAKAADMHRYIESRQAAGKLVLAIDA